MLSCMPSFFENIVSYPFTYFSISATPSPNSLFSVSMNLDFFFFLNSAYKRGHVEFVLFWLTNLS